MAPFGAVRNDREIADDVAACEQQALLLQADITDPDDVTAMFARIKAVWKKLDFLILNAKWGLEQG
jgi:NAD(P)-dependent dehydrogenase (short-subunit alcohol dehydrogenase family)